MMRSAALLALLPALLLITPCLAQQPAMDHAAPASPTTDSPAAAFRRADAAMMHGMAVAPTGDVDHDFVNGMLPHHQGAIDMARIELQHGKDPVLRRLARAIVAAQDQEMRLMRDWLRKHPN